MQRVIAALRAWRDAQALALEAEAELASAINEELGGGHRAPQELADRVKRLRDVADQRFGHAMAVIESERA